MNHDCPSISDLVGSGDGLASRAAAVASAAEHARSCDACHAVLLLSETRTHARPGGGGARANHVRSTADTDACARVEVLVASLVDGMITSDEQRELALHVAACSECDALVVRMTAVGSVLDDIAGPVTHAPVTHEPFTTDPVTTDEPAFELPRASGSRTTFDHESTPGLRVPAGAAAPSSWLGRFLPPRAHRVAWIVELAAAAAIAGLVVHAVERSSNAPAPTAERDAPPVTGGAPAAPPRAGGGDANEAKLRDTELRITAAEERVRDLEKSLEGRGAASATPSASSSPSGASSGSVSSPTAPRGTGALTVTCSPFCTSIVVDGINIGTSPIVGHAIAAGVHSVLLLKEDTPSKNMTVTIKAGETSRLSVDMGGRSRIDVSEIQ